MGWNSCSANLAAFTSFSAAYVNLLVVARLASIDAADNLLDFQARAASQELKRVALSDLNYTVLSSFQILKRYITYAFPANQTQILLDSAGWGYYPEASNQNWDSSEQMLNSMDIFISANSVLLLANSNMPIGFPATVAALYNTFASQHLDYESERQTTYISTETKVNANNAIYTECISMFSDAQLLGFSPALGKQFVFSSVLSLVSGAGAAGISGFVTDSVTLLPVPNCEVRISSLGVSVLTGVDGSYLVSGIPADSYTVDYVPAPPTNLDPPYIPQALLVVVPIGTVTVVDVALTV
jgi:hypothetical protein